MNRAAEELARRLDRELYALVTRVCFRRENQGEVRKHLEELPSGWEKLPSWKRCGPERWRKRSER